MFFSGYCERYPEYVVIGVVVIDELYSYCKCQKFLNRLEG
jgi:hypothetical protein